MRGLFFRDEYTLFAGGGDTVNVDAAVFVQLWHGAVGDKLVGEA